MAKGKRSSRIYTNFIISYIITLLCPLLIMSFFVLFSFVNTLKNEVTTNIANSFKETVKQFELQMEQLQKTSLQIELNSELSFNNVSNRPIDYIYIRDELSKYNTSSFADEILIYNYLDNYISSLNYSYTLKDFNSVFMPSVDFESIIWRFKSSSDKNALYFFSEQEINLYSKGYLMYLNKIPVHSSKHHALVMYLIPQSAMQRILKPAVITDNTYVFIKEPGSERTLLSFSGDNDTQKATEISKFLGSMKNSELRELKMNKERFSVFHVKSSQLNLEFIQLIPNNLMSDKINEIRILFMISMVIIIILSGFIISILMRVNYRPINNLRKLIEESIYTKYAIKDQLNELEILEHALLLYNKENSTLQDIVKNNNSIVQQYLLDCFLYGQAKEIERMDETCKLAGLDFNRNYYCIILLKTNGTDYDNKVESIESILENQDHPDPVQYFIKKDISNKKLVILFGSNADSEKNSRDLSLKIIQHMKSEYSDPVRVGIGSYVNDIFNVHKSYQEALKVLDYNYSLSQSYITSISELSSIDETNNKYPFELFEHLKSAVREKDALKIEATINKLLQFIKTENLTLHWAKNLCYDIVNTIYKEFLLKKNHSVFMNKPYIEKIYGNEINTFEDIETTMAAVINDITGFLNADERTYELKLLQQITLYIRENYLDPNFSLQSLAESLDMSPPYLSQYFKKNTNYTISEYVTKLRMEKAKELLMETEISVNDIAMRVGYYSVSSFIRKFKEVEDLTPGQYRSTTGN